MMRRLSLRASLVVLAFVTLYFAMQSGSNAGFIQTQRAQRGIPITINVTPGPYGYAPSRDREIALAHKYGRGSGDNLEPRIIAQASVQHAVPVEANVTPDPTATMFNVNPGSATINVTAGQTATVTCALILKVNTTVTLWTVDVGLSNDFSTTFNGTNLSHNSYLSTPKPTSTPFTVYPDNNNAWSIMDKNGGTQTYCIDLTVTVPITVLGGVYYTNAIYTLFY